MLPKICNENQLAVIIMGGEGRPPKTRTSPPYRRASIWVAQDSMKRPINTPFVNELHRGNRIKSFTHICVVLDVYCLYYSHCDDHQIFLSGFPSIAQHYLVECVCAIRLFVVVLPNAKWIFVCWFTPLDYTDRWINEINIFRCCIRRSSGGGGERSVPSGIIINNNNHSIFMCVCDVWLSSFHTRLKLFSVWDSSAWGLYHWWGRME